VFQSFHLLEDYTVLDNILMPARIGRRSTSAHSDARKQALDLLKQVGLEHRAEFFTKQLSGGEKQRVAIARALLNNPDLILADEPSGNLDRHNAEIIHQLLLSCSQNQGKSLVIVTHDHHLASLCDKQYLLSNGRLTSTLN
jgi:lipoprotein-releasing system ATP-binding protein